MKKYSMIHIPLMSFYSGELYRDVGLHWKGVGFIYLFLLLCICGIPSVIQVHLRFSDFVDNEAPPYVSQIPQITIEDGEAFVDVNQPHYIVDPHTQAVLAIIDTTGTITSLEGTEARALITQGQAIVKRNEFETRTIAFDQIEQFTLDQQRIYGWLNTLKKYLAAVMFPFMLFGSLIFRIVQLLIYAAIGLLMASWCRSNRSYTSLLRLAVVAVTPGIIVKTVLGFTSIQIPFAGLAYFGVAMAYLFFGVQVSSHADEDQPTDYLRVEDAGPGVQ